MRSTRFTFFLVTVSLGPGEQPPEANGARGWYQIYFLLRLGQGHSLPAGFLDEQKQALMTSRAETKSAREILNL
jgi:hypothetical protein